MGYDYLPEELRPIADAVCSYLKDNRGVRTIHVESIIDPRIQYKPTISGNTNRGYLTCVDVSPSPYPPALDAFVLDCIKFGLPVKLYVANPESKSGAVDERAIRRASSLGVGRIIISGDRIEVTNEALELSLIIQEIDTKIYPKKCRTGISDAISTYQNGNPVKGVSDICDQLEEIIRKIAIKAKGKGMIPSSNKLNLERGALANVIQLMTKHQVIRSAPLLARCLAITHIRNDSDHPPANYQRRIKRHGRLRTHLNTALDLLKDLTDIKIP